MMNKHRKVTLFLYIFPAILLVVVFIYFPIIQNIVFSFYRWSSFSSNKIFVGFANYISIFNDKTFYIALKNSFLYTIISLIFQVWFGLVIASILEEKFICKLKPFFRTVFFIPSMLSLTAVGLLWTFIYDPGIGILNSALKKLELGSLAYAWLGDTRTAIYAIIAVTQWQFTGFMIMLFLVGLEEIPQETYDAAMIDGANRIQTFFNITIPQLKPTILLTSTITIISSFKIFDEVYVMTFGGPGRASEVLGTYMYKAAFRTDQMGLASAIGCIIFFITFVASIYRIKLYRKTEI